MAKMKPEDLDKISEKIKKMMNLREGEGKVRIIVHMGTCGIAAGARPVMKTFVDEVEKHDAKDVLVTISSCAGLCSREPMATVEAEGIPQVKYVDLTPEKAKRIFEEHVLGGRVVTEYALAVGSERMF